MLGKELIDGKWYVVRRNPRDLTEFAVVEPLRIVYSPTGESHGSGTEPWRWVSRLTQEERNLVKSGHIVVIDRGVSVRAPLPVQVVIYQGGRYNHRVPSPDLADVCLKVAGYSRG